MIKRSYLTRALPWIAPVAGVFAFLTLTVLILEPKYFNVLDQYNGSFSVFIAIGAALITITASARTFDEKLDKDAERLRLLKIVLNGISRSVKVEIFYLNKQIFVSERRAIFDVDESHLQMAVANMGRYTQYFAPLIRELESSIDCMRRSHPHAITGLTVQMNTEERKQLQLKILEQIHEHCQHLTRICDKELAWL